MDLLNNLNPLFESGIYGANKAYSVSSKDGTLKGTLKASFSGMEYSCDLAYAHDVLPVRVLSGELSLPTWTKAGIFSKENKVKMIEVSEYTITSMNFDGDKHVDLSFVNKKGDQKFKIVSDNDTYQIYQGEFEITADEKLLQSLNIDNIAGVVDEVKKYLEHNVKFQKLNHILLDGEDAVRNNEVFDCLKLIAEQYGEIVSESLDKGYVKNEITIKIEAEDGTRTEKYITKEEAFDQLAELGSEGLELASILGVD
jgi:C4-type Zn-finger protein